MSRASLEAGLHATLEIPILGVPTRFAAADEELLSHVRHTFGAWLGLASSPDVLSRARVTVRLHRRSGTGDGPGAPVSYERRRDDLLVVSTPASHGVADLGAGEVTAHVTDELLADAAHFGYAFLSALTLAAITVHDRVPLHAAAVARGDAALLLHGPSGVGKSSLVLAAAARGMRVLSEDVVYAELEAGPRLWGMPGPVHVSEDALRFFPGLRPVRRVVRAGGQAKLAVTLPGGDPSPMPATRAGICLLRRSAGPPTLSPATEQEVHEVLGGARESGFDRFARAAARATGLVAGGGAWHLAVGGDPQAAAGALDPLLDGLGDPGEGGAR
ncbi:MAG: hypothetical protein AMXMBFR53_17960 [Gemmatimonadota bacterium]